MQQQHNCCGNRGSPVQSEKSGPNFERNQLQAQGQPAASNQKQQDVSGQAGPSGNVPG